MIARLGKAMNRLSERFVPDPFILVLLLTMAIIILGTFFGQNINTLPVAERLARLADGWYGEFYKGGLMKFALQMCIVLITGHALALSSPVQKLIKSLTKLASTPGSAVIVVALTSAIASLIQWGMGVIVGAFIAREMGKSFARQNKPVHYPLLGAAGYAGFMVWHGGLSGSAPLKVAGPKHFLVKEIGVIPVSQTLFSTLNIAVIVSLLIVIPLVLWRLMPSSEDDMVGYDLPLEHDDALADDDVRPKSLLGLLEHTRTLNLIASTVLIGWLGYYFSQKGVRGWNLDAINILFLTLGLLFHQSPRAYTAAISDGAKGAAGIILQFPFYFGIVGLLKASGLIGQIAQWFVDISTSTTFPVWTFISAGVVNFLVPSGGGQWAVQGPVMMKAIESLNIQPANVIMALSYGDAWTNMLQPFWALPLLGIMGLKAKDIIGYTTFVMLVTGPVIIFWLLIFS